MNVLLRLLADLLLRFVRSLDLPLLAGVLALMGIGRVALANGDFMRSVFHGRAQKGLDRFPQAIPDMKKQQT